MFVYLQSNLCGGGELHPSLLPVVAKIYDLTYLLNHNIGEELLNSPRGQLQSLSLFQS